MVPRWLAPALVGHLAVTQGSPRTVRALWVAAGVFNPQGSIQSSPSDRLRSTTPNTLWRQSKEDRELRTLILMLLSLVWAARQ